MNAEFTERALRREGGGSWRRGGLWVLRDALKVLLSAGQTQNVHAEKLLPLETTDSVVLHTPVRMNTLTHTHTRYPLTNTASVCL